MSKRKATAGGYEDSSDGSDIEFVDTPEQGPKRSKLTPYAPPRLTTASGPSLGGFRFPVGSSLGRGSVPPRHMSISSSNRPTPTPDGIQTVSHTPEIRICKSLSQLFHLIFSHHTTALEPEPEPRSSSASALSKDGARIAQAGMYTWELTGLFWI